MKKLQKFIAPNSLSLVAFLLPVVFFILITIVFPRPYTIFFTDAEQTMYYGSKLVFFGHQPNDLSHPGITSYDIGALIMKISGPDIQKTQLFLQLGYFLVAIATGLTMVLFSKRILKNIPFGIGLLSLVLFFCFPSVLMYSDMLNAGSFIFIFAFLALILFWSALGSENAKEVALYYSLTGIILGISLANHVVTLILLAIICLVGFMKALAMKTGLIQRLLVLLTLPFSALISYFILIYPVLNRVRAMWSHLFGLNAIQPSFERLFTGISILLRNACMLPETVIQIAIALIFLIVTGMLILREVRAQHFTNQKNWMEQALLLFLLLFAFLYILSTSITYESPGITVRYTMAFVALFSFELVFIYAHTGKDFKPNKIIGLGAMSLSILILIASLIGFFQIRSVLISQRSEAIDQNLAYFERMNTGDGRIAFWDGSPGFLFGEMSFHFWGDFRYGNNIFDKELLSAYPHYSFFRLRKADFIINKDPINEIVTGEWQGEKFDLIVFPADQIGELGNTSLASLRSLLNDRLGPTTSQETMINGAQWYIFRVQNSK